MTTVVPIVDGTTVVVETGSGTSVVLTNSVVKVSTGSDVDLSNYYTKSEIDEEIEGLVSAYLVSLAKKAPLNHTHSYTQITNLSSAPLQGGTF